MNQHKISPAICREIKEVRKGKQSKEFEKYSEDFRNVEVGKSALVYFTVKTMFWDVFVLCPSGSQRAWRIVCAGKLLGENVMSFLFYKLIGTGSTLLTSTYPVTVGTTYLPVPVVGTGSYRTVPYLP